MKNLKFNLTSLVLLCSFVFISCQNEQKANTSSKELTEAKTISEKTKESKIVSASSDVIMHPEYAKTLAREAYIWGYPMVNMMNRKTALSQAPEPGRLGGVLPVAPTGKISMLYDYIDPGQNFIACPNQDVVYGLGFFSLDEQPVIIQVPDFGDRFYVYAIYDARTDQVGEIGKPYDTKPGMYLLHGPNWNGEVPEGIAGVIESPTALANCIPRMFMDDTDEDRKALQPLVNQVMVYPLTEYTGKMKTKDWKKAPIIPNPAGSDGGETKWVVPEKYFDQFGEVLATVPPIPGEEAMYSQFQALMEVAEKNPEIKKIITEEAVKLDATLVKDFLQWKYNGKPAGNGWNRSQHNAEWGVDYYNRAGTSRSNMFDNRPNETQYFYTDYTTDNVKLNGSSNFKVVFNKGELPPVEGFWSLTMYNEAHFFYPNDLKRYSLGTKNKGLQYGKDGSLTIYVGNKSPGKDKASNWLPAPPEDFSIYLRAYWGKKGITDGTWTPPVVEKY